MFELNEKMDKTRAYNLSPVVLAFVGDAVYSLYIRNMLIFEADYKLKDLNKLAVERVKATAQADFVSRLLDVFTEEELSVYKRGRNAKKTSRTKSATASEYNSSTGFEAVVGYLYLIGNYERLNYILSKGN